MTIRVDKCYTFGMAKKETLSVQTHPKLFVNNEQIPALKNNESFKYLCRYYNSEMDNEEHEKTIRYYQQIIEENRYASTPSKA